MLESVPRGVVRSRSDEVFLRAMRKGVIFDRDGTLIIDRIYLNDPQKIEYLPGVFDALKSVFTSALVLAYPDPSYPL